MFFLRQNPEKKRGNPFGIKLWSLSLLSFHIKWRGELMYLLDPSGLTGLEPATSALTGRCSCLLNYNPREIRRDLTENLASFLFSLIRYFLRTRGFYHLIVYWRIFGPSWIWTSVDILPTNLQSVPINRSGIDPGRINFRLIGNPWSTSFRSTLPPGEFESPLPPWKRDVLNR